MSAQNEDSYNVDEEQLTFPSLVAMFGGKIPTDTILNVMKQNQNNIEKCIDELLSLPEPSSLSEEDFEILPPVNIELTLDEYAEEPPQEVSNSLIAEPDEYKAESLENSELMVPLIDDASPIDSPLQSIMQSSDFSRGGFAGRIYNTRSISPDREQELLNRIKELEESNIRLENEKKNGMKFVLGRLEESKKEISQREETISRLEGELADLHRVLRENKRQHSKLEKLILLSKDALSSAMNGVHGIEQATEKRWAEIQFEANQILHSTNEFFTEHDLNFIERLKEFATSIRESFSHKSAKFDRPIQLNEEEEKNEDYDEEPDEKAEAKNDEELEEGMTEEEVEELRQAKLASLESYAVEQALN